MYAVTDAFHAACKGAGREFTKKVQFNGETDVAGTSLSGITLNEVFDSSDGISIGSTCSSYIKCKLRQPETRIPLSGGYLVPSCGLKVAGTVVYIPLGKFYVTDVNAKSNPVEITAYDGMSKLERDYVPTVSFPAAVTSVAADICQQCGVTLDSGVTFPSYTISKLSTGTCKQQIGWIAGLMGKNACFDRNGNLTFRWYASAGLTVERSNQYMGGLERTTVDNFVVRSLTTGTKESPVTAGTGTGITSMNPYMTQEIANTVYDQIKGTVIAPAKLKWRGDPSVECGDIISAVDRSGTVLPVAVMGQEIKLSGGLSISASCYGKSDAAAVMDKRPSDAKLEQMYAGLTAALQTATQRIIGGAGGYWRLTFDESGEFPTGWVIQDTPTVTPSTRMWIMSAGGLGYSVDGGTTITKVALTMDGAVNADCITTGQLSAERISVNGATLSDFLRVTTDTDGHPVLQIGSSKNAVVLKQQNDCIAFYDLQDNPLTSLDVTSFLMPNLKKFQLGSGAVVVQPNGSLSIVKAV